MNNCIIELSGYGGLFITLILPHRLIHFCVHLAARSEIASRSGPECICINGQGSSVPWVAKILCAASTYDGRIRMPKPCTHIKYECSTIPPVLTLSAYLNTLEKQVSYAELTSGDSKLTVSPGKLSFAQGNGLGPCPL